jgi:formate hydrogenlyase subunit 5
MCRLHCSVVDFVPFCEWLASASTYIFAMLVVEQNGPELRLIYTFYRHTGGEWIEVTLSLPAGRSHVPSIAAIIPAADWHEREAADLFGLEFEGHPRLEPFVLHEGWAEDAPLMRADFAMRERFTPPTKVEHPSAERILEAPGAFAMPIGPVFSDTAESAHFRIGSVGEDVSRVWLQLFYKYRAVEKRAEGQPVDTALLLAERFSGTAAFAHGLAFCQAVEAITGTVPPPRALALRTLLAELERLRSHAATITGICNSTALAVATSVSAILEEELLRLSCILTGHRYFFGCLAPGGLRRDIPDRLCREISTAVAGIATRLDRFERMLRESSSFLDRLEEMGIVPSETADLLGLVGPVARGSCIRRDMRQLLPYAAYARYRPEVPLEREGDCYARLRVLFHEAAASAALIGAISANLPEGQVNVAEFRPVPGAATGIVETPLGAAFHWVRLGANGTIRRLRIAPPSFANWRGFQSAAESFAFQDFPIILASFGLSTAENDR